MIYYVLAAGVNNMEKRIIATVIFIVLFNLTAFCAPFLQAASTDITEQSTAFDTFDAGALSAVSDKCGKDAYAELNTDTDSLIFSGSGRMYDYYFQDTPWYKEKFCTIAIHSGISYIGEEAFSACNAKYVFIPSTVEEIGDYAFSVCKNLAYVFYEGSIKDWEKIKIGEYNEALTNAELKCDFYAGCIIGKGECGDGVTWSVDGLRTLYINGVGKMELDEGYSSHMEFYDFVTSVKIGDSITYIPDGAFNGFAFLKEATIGKSVEYIGISAFDL